MGALDFDEVVDGRRIEPTSSGGGPGSAYMNTLRKSPEDDSGPYPAARNDPSALPRASSHRQHAVGDYPTQSGAGARASYGTSPATAVGRALNNRSERGTQTPERGCREGDSQDYVASGPSVTRSTPQVPLKSEQQVKVSALPADPLGIDISQAGTDESKLTEERFDLGNPQQSTLAFAANRTRGPAYDYATVKLTVAPVAVKFRQAARPQLLNPALQASLPTNYKCLRPNPSRPIARALHTLPHQNHQTLPNPRPILALPAKRPVGQQSVNVLTLRSAPQAN